MWFQLNLKPISKLCVRLGSSVSEVNVLLKCNETFIRIKIAILWEIIFFLVFKLQRKFSCGHCSSQAQTGCDHFHQSLHIMDHVTTQVHRLVLPVQLQSDWTCLIPSHCYIICGSGSKKKPEAKLEVLPDI